MLVRAGPLQPWGVWRQCLRKEHNRAVLPASCQPSQTPRAFCTTHLIALGIPFYRDMADVSLQRCRESIHPCARAWRSWVSLDPGEINPQGMVFLFLPWSSLCLCRQGSRLRQKPSLRRTRAWCGSCWSSCGLAWTCPGWCCPPSSWSLARSLTNSPTTTTMPTCSPSKQHTRWAWPGHFSFMVKISLCVCQKGSQIILKSLASPYIKPGTSCSEFLQIDCCQWGARKEKLNSRQTHLCIWTCLPLLAGTDGNSADALEFCTTELCHLLVCSCTYTDRGIGQRATKIIRYFCSPKQSNYDG